MQRLSWRLVAASHTCTAYPQLGALLWAAGKHTLGVHIMICAMELPRRRTLAADGGELSIMDDSVAARDGHLSPTARSQLAATIEGWQNSLVGMDRRNKLLNFKHTRTSTLELVDRSPTDIVADLRRGWYLRHTPAPPVADSPNAGSASTDAEPEERDTDHPGTEPLSADEVRTTKKSAAELNNALRSLHRASTAAYLDRGLWILYAGVGILKWIDVDEGVNESPLVLVPTALERTGAQARHRLLAHDEEEITFNQALSIKFEKLGIRLPVPADADDLDIPTYLDTVREAVRGRAGWQVEERTVLATFSFAKEVMYRDLVENAEVVATHPLIRVLGLKAENADPAAERDLDFSPVPDAELDEVAPPETAPLVINADSSQRRCVQAALDGKSFVMQGPPGTGKTQTIANIISALMHAGRSVLFVSEKAAALDVAYLRLAEVGLSHYVLKLHSDKTSRKAVAQELGYALKHLQQAPLGIGSVERDRLREMRVDLSDYAAAMNEVRTPLQLSLHAAIGRIDAVREAPALRYDGPDIRELSEREFSGIRQASERLAGAWRPAVEGDMFAWRGAADAVGHRVLLDDAERALRGLNAALEQHGALARPLGLTSLGTVPQLVSLIESAQHRPQVPVEWLVSDDFASVEAAVHRFAAVARDVRTATSEAQRRAGADWSALAWLAHMSRPEPADTHVPPIDVSAETADGIIGIIAWLRNQSAQLSAAAMPLARAAAAFGLPSPSTFQAADELVELARLAGAELRPEMEWLDERGHALAAESCRVLRDAAAAEQRARFAASHLYNVDVLTIPGLEAVVERFETGHGAAAKVGLSRQFKQDRAFVTALTVSGDTGKSLYAQLPLAIAWRQAHQRFLVLATSHAPALGRYFSGLATDFDLVGRLLADAQNIIALARQADPQRVRRLCAAGNPKDDATVSAGQMAQLHLGRWHDATHTAPFHADWTALDGSSLTDVEGWCAAQLPYLEDAQRVTSVVAESSGTAVLAYSEAGRALTAVVHAARARKDLAARQAEDRARLGGLYAGEGTVEADLTGAIAWAKDVRTRAATDAGGALPRESAAYLLQMAPSRNVAQTYDAWVLASAALLELFDVEYRDSLAAVRLHSADSAAAWIRALQNDLRGVDEWHAYTSTTAKLRAAGLAAVIERFTEDGIAPELLRPSCEHTLLRAWSDRIIADDERIRVTLTEDRDALVAHYQQLDLQAVASARGLVIAAVEGRKGFGVVGAAGLIRQEAQKKKRHIPVRELISKSVGVVQVIKPCFMMSPVTVSQFIKPEVGFDAVIFDEASQILPADAINSLYRASQLIVAGDQRQLPPTAFFTGVDDEETVDDDEGSSSAGDFDSLLDLCVATRFKQLPLRWHYRSRHEALISFSNRAFYRDELITFPGPYEEHPDFGVKFIKVSGTYRRGSQADNPQEALEVARRVIHHYSTRPQETLGVVTLSVKQADAIENALESLRPQFPQIAHHLLPDRNRGFFVKSIESVQGDERDVIILSVGYGRDADGKLSMNFGPMSRAGGERRLNVAVTRAKTRVEVVSSIHGHDIQSGTNESLRHFKRYLEFAELGLNRAFADGSVDFGEPDSPFEESVLATLRSWGYDAVSQVGVSGYRIDIGIRHPDHAGAYVLGVECDGAAYHSAKVARDRDRLRETVLRGLGWDLYRIWGTVWYRDRRAAEESLRAAVDKAIDGFRPDREPGDTPDSSAVPALMVAEPFLMPAPEPQESRDWVAEYVEAMPQPGRSPYELHETAAWPEMHRIIREVIVAEAPVHTKAVLDRLRVAWGVGRSGSRITENFNALLHAMRTRGEIILDAGFVNLPRRDLVKVRVPGAMRSVEQIPAAERRLALHRLTAESPGSNRDELMGLTARLFGWRRIGSDIGQALTADIEELLASGELSEDTGRLTAM